MRLRCLLGRRARALGAAALPTSRAARAPRPHKRRRRRQLRRGIPRKTRSTHKAIGRLHRGRGAPVTRVFAPSREGEAQRARLSSRNSLRARGPSRGALNAAPAVRRVELAIYRASERGAARPCGAQAARWRCVCSPSPSAQVRAARVGRVSAACERAARAAQCVELDRTMRLALSPASLSPARASSSPPRTHTKKTQRCPPRGR